MSLFVFGKGVSNSVMDRGQLMSDYPAMRFDSFDPEDVAVLDAQALRVHGVDAVTTVLPGLTHDILFSPPAFSALEQLLAKY